MMRLDAIWVPGVGLTYQLAEGRAVDDNANYLNLGNATVDTGEGLLGRRVVGESTDPYAITLELAYHSRKSHNLSLLRKSGMEA